MRFWQTSFYFFSQSFFSSRDLGAIDSDSNYFSGGETERGESKLSHYSERKLSDSSSSSDTSCPVSKLSADTNYFSDSNFSDSYSVTTERRQIYECRYSRLERSVLETTPQRLGGQESNNSSQYSNNSCQYSNNSCLSDNNISHLVNNNIGLPANNNSSSRSGNNNIGNSVANNNRSANNSRHSTNNSSYSRSTIISSLSANSSPEVERGDVISTHSNREVVKLSSVIFRNICILFLQFLSSGFLQKLL